MKGFILAALFSIAYAALVLILFAISLPERRAALMLRAHLFSVPLLLACVAATPADLWFLPAWLSERNAWLDGAFSFFAFSASVFGGWLQLYNLADRGLSLRILIEAAESSDATVTPQYLQAAYGQGRGILWMYDKRIQDLLRLGLVRREGEFLELSGNGRRNARLILWLRRVYAIPTRDEGAH